jgi:hypothetical protein
VGAVSQVSAYWLTPDQVENLRRLIEAGKLEKVRLLVLQQGRQVPVRDRHPLLGPPLMGDLMGLLALADLPIPRPTPLDSGDLSLVTRSQSGPLARAIERFLKMQGDEGYLKYGMGFAAMPGAGRTGLEYLRDALSIPEECEAVALFAL